MQTLGERIAYLRTSKRLTQAELMNELNFYHLSRYENNSREPSLSVLISLAKYFNVSLDWLLTGEDFQQQSTNQHLTESENRFLQLYRQLDATEQIKLEGALEYKILESTKSKSMLSPSEDDSIDLLA